MRPLRTSVHLPPAPRSTLKLIRRPGRKGMGRGGGSKDDVGIYFLCRKLQLMPPRCNFCLTSSSKQRIRKKDVLPPQKCGVEGRGSTRAKGARSQLSSPCLLLLPRIPIWAWQAAPPFLPRGGEGDDHDEEQTTLSPPLFFPRKRQEREKGQTYNRLMGCSFFS